jgi:hypothetical protein
MASPSQLMLCSKVLSSESLAATLDANIRFSKIPTRPSPDNFTTRDIKEPSRLPSVL